MRILTDIPDEDIERLDALAAGMKRSRAAAIRDAVKLYLAQNGSSKDWIERGYGFWAGRSDSDGESAVRDDRTRHEEL